jgi:hypothetical protein
MSGRDTNSGRVESANASDLMGLGEAVKSANDSYREDQLAVRKVRRAPRRYVTRARVEQVGSGLTDRDRYLVEEVARLRLVSGQQLRRLAYADSDSGRRMARLDLARLVERRVLARLDRRIGGVRAGADGYVYSLDMLGQRLIAPDRPRAREPWTPQPPYLAHALAVSDLYVGLREIERKSNWQLDGFDGEPRCWLGFSGPGGPRLTLKPDAYLVGGNAQFEDAYFIEVDRHTESLPRLRDKAMTYVRYWQSGREQSSSGLFPRVLWLAPSERRRLQIVQVLGELDPLHWQLFGVTTHDLAAPLIAGVAEASTTAEEHQQ